MSIWGKELTYVVNTEEVWPGPSYQHPVEGAWNPKIESHFSTERVASFLGILVGTLKSKILVELDL